MKDYDIALSGRRSIERTIQVMDIEGKDEAIQKAEIELAKAMGCEVSELSDIQVERCLYIDPNEDADYAAPQKTMRGM